MTRTDYSKLRLHYPDAAVNGGWFPSRAHGLSWREALERIAEEEREQAEADELDRYDGVPSDVWMTWERAVGE